MVVVGLVMVLTAAVQCLPVVLLVLLLSLVLGLVVDCCYRVPVSGLPRAPTVGLWSFWL